jgi:hypothetical protein
MLFKADIPSFGINSYRSAGFARTAFLNKTLSHRTCIVDGVLVLPIISTLEFALAPVKYVTLEVA